MAPDVKRDLSRVWGGGEGCSWIPAVPRLGKSRADLKKKVQQELAELEKQALVGGPRKSPHRAEKALPQDLGHGGRDLYRGGSSCRRAGESRRVR